MKMKRNSKGQFVKGSPAYWKGKKFTPEMRQKLSEVHKKLYLEGKETPPSRLGMPAPNKGKVHMPDDKHPAWKGEDVGYHALHRWIQRKLGKPTKCEHCGIDGLTGHQIHWANVSGEYYRSLDDWIRLCAKCHHKMDGNTAKGWVTRRAVKF